MSDPDPQKTTPQLIDSLLGNYFNALYSLQMAFIFDRDGLLIARKVKENVLGQFSDQEDKDQDENEIMGAITGVVEKTLTRITSEYQIGSFGTGTFDTDDNRLVFTEAGPNAILLSVFEFDVSINGVLPYVFLIAEKIAQIVSGKFDPEIFDLEVPGLDLGLSFDVSTDDLLSPISYCNDEGTANKMTFKLIVLGDEATGKTSIINKFATNRFYDEYRPTLGISITNMEYGLQGFQDEGAVIKLMLWDLAGQSFFKRVRKNYYVAANSVFILYDITRRDTFENVNDWYEDMRSVLTNTPVVIVGNKIDMESERKVSTEEGKQLATKLKASFIETSALTGKNIKNVFSLIGIGLFFKACEEDQ